MDSRFVVIIVSAGGLFPFGVPSLRQMYLELRACRVWSARRRRKRMPVMGRSRIQFPTGPPSSGACRPRQLPSSYG
jgi:hypothetical protein